MSVGWCLLFVVVGVYCCLSLKVCWAFGVRCLSVCDVCCLLLFVLGVVDG